MRKTFVAFSLSLLLAYSVSAGVMQNDKPKPPEPAPTPQETTPVPGPTNDGVMQNDGTEGTTEEVLADILFGVLALF